MEDGGNLRSTFERTYNKLVSQDELNADDNPLYTNEDERQVSLSMVRPDSCLNHYRLITVCLSVLAVILLAVDIGLGVYYNRLTDGERTVRDISAEVAKLQDAYNTAVKNRDEVKEQLAKELSLQRLTKWELEHQKRRSKDYETQISLLSAVTEEGCRHCLPGWTFVNSQCYYFPFSDTVMRKSWGESRNFCKRYGGDLAVIDNKEKQVSLSIVFNTNCILGDYTLSRQSNFINLKKKLFINVF
ncbi:C-type lectin domain family 9 member A-like [Sphaeramia orbicularis]|uniref:C-type lectin domain family 9 member A-like n=1 Tax=Sphaeramia orbicularis TaxID=375764 RepID=UPI00117F5FAA|nr:C-type lectin domain family 9 member A-like [Sphaeramia orbicularis]